MNVSIVTLGCKTNQFESAAMRQQLEAEGYKVVPFDEAADLVLINTCTVTARTDAQSRKLIRRARRSNPQARIVVTGCYAQIDPDSLQQMDGVSLVIGNEEKADLIHYLQSSGANKNYVSDIRQIDQARALPLYQFAEKSRAFVQIQNGCDAFCSYCIIPYARGASRSVPQQQIIGQIQQLVDGGYTEVVLTGIHIGGYGKDLQPQSSLLNLLERVDAETSLRRLRLGSIEPNEISDRLITQIAQSAMICPHFHIPLQSGSDAVLQRMNRQYTAEDFERLMTRIRQQIPDAAIGLDVIVGFPGETEDEFRQTFELIDRLPVAFLHVFPFSVRPGTPAASMTPQINPSVVKDRAARLRTLAADKQRHFATAFEDTQQEVVALGNGQGLTRHYLSVALPEGEYCEGQIYQVPFVADPLTAPLASDVTEDFT